LACPLLLPCQSILVVPAFELWPSIIYVSVFVSSSRPWPLHDVFRSPFFIASLNVLKEMFWKFHVTNNATTLRHLTFWRRCCRRSKSSAMLRHAH
jgi:hypothetical protein